MNKKEELKKILFLASIFIIIVLFINILICTYEYRVYTQQFNYKINQLVEDIVKNNPNINEIELIQILNSSTTSTTDVLKKYGINLHKDSAILINEQYFKQFLILNTILICVVVIILIALFIHHNAKKDKKITEIIHYLEQINQKNYTININSMAEDELSILRNEIYKTTITLKEAAEKSNLDKINLKQSLQDISHQLKTPLTSILIMLDNLIDDPDMDKEVRDDFIKDIKREVSNINFLVQSILKLSKLDTNTVNFIKEKVNLYSVIQASITNVSTLCDLRNINIFVESDQVVEIECDYRWQVEALTNILKNCIEHSNEYQSIEVKLSQNKIYALVEIRDFGQGISSVDLPYIFKRFYKGTNASYDSVGIGLALSKKIIESDNGVISVDSSNKGTVFKIKFFKVHFN